MRVQHLLVEEITYAGDARSASLHATLYEFGEERFVSAHPGTPGQQLGPLTVIDTPPGKSLDLPTALMQPFPPRPLPVDQNGKVAISHRTWWTVDPDTVYAIRLPPGFVAESVVVETQDGEGLQLEAAAEESNRLFYWGLFMGRRLAFQVSGRFVSDLKRAERLAASVDVVKGRSKFERLSDAVPRAEVDPSYWMKFLEYGSSLLP